MSSSLTAIDDGLVDRVLAINAGVKRLNLARNAIADVTPAVGRLAGTLTCVDVGHNQLRRLGPAWAELPGLTSVLAASNEMCVAAPGAVAVCPAPRAPLPCARARRDGQPALSPASPRITAPPAPPPPPHNAHRDPQRRP